MNSISKQLRDLQKQKLLKVDYVSNWLFNQNVELENPFDRSPITDRLRTEMKNIRNINFQLGSLKEMKKKLDKR